MFLFLFLFSTQIDILPDRWLNFVSITTIKTAFEPPHDKTNETTVRPAKTQISLSPPSLIRVFAVRSVGS